MESIELAISEFKKAFEVAASANSSSFFLDISTIVISTITLVVSFFSVWINRRSVVTSSITSQRIEWISHLRKLIYSFTKEYRTSRQKNELILIYTEICLYMTPASGIYQSLVEAMKSCIYSQVFSEKLYWLVVVEGQRVLNYSWKMMKREAGISQQRETKRSNNVKNEIQDASPTWNPAIDSAKIRVKYAPRRVQAFHLATPTKKCRK